MCGFVVIFLLSHVFVYVGARTRDAKPLIAKVKFNFSLFFSLFILRSFFRPAADKSDSQRE